VENQVKNVLAPQQKIGVSMNILGFHFHSWKNIKVETTRTFLGEDYQELEDSGLRICHECKQVQEYLCDSQGGLWYNWFNLNNVRQEIVKHHIQFLAGSYVIPHHTNSNFYKPKYTSPKGI